MPFLFIRTCNSEFESIDEGADYKRAEDALALGVEGAISIVRDEIRQSGNTSAVEVSVEAGDGEPMLRSVVTISIASLWVTTRSTKPAS